MRRRPLLIAGALLLLILVGGSSLLGETTEPHLPLTELKSFSTYSNMPEDAVPVGGGRRGFAFTSEYNMTTPWTEAALGLDAELKALGFTRAGPLTETRVEWDRQDLHVSVRAPRRPKPGEATYRLRLTRPGTLGERLRDRYYDLRYSLRRP